jgi:hypothetical protein
MARLQMLPTSQHVVCVCVCVCVYVCVSVNVCVYVCEFVFVCVFACARVHACVKTLPWRCLAAFFELLHDMKQYLLVS